MAGKITKDNPKWIGSPTHLVGYLGVDMKANNLSLKLNVLASRLLNEYGIRYVNDRNHGGRYILLCLEEYERDDA